PVNLAGGQLGGIILLAKRVPILLHHVSGIICRSTEKKVIRVYTISDVAFMTNQVSAGNLTAKEVPGDAMGAPSFVFGDQEGPVTIRNKNPSPQPAPGVRLLSHFVHKSFQKSSFHGVGPFCFRFLC